MNKRFRVWRTVPHGAAGWLLPLLLAIPGQSAPALDWQPLPVGRARPVQYARNTKPGFTRLTPAQTGIGFVNWLTPESDARNANLINGAGVALGDVDGDGWCDLYFCNINGTNTLYKNLGHWKFADITAASGLGLVNQLSRGACFADVDGDGDLDLIVTFNGRGARLFLNDGQGHFAEDTQAGLTQTRGGSSVAFGDLDGDGRLDLYVANYGEDTIVRGGGSYSIRYVNGKPVVTGRWARRLKIEGNRLVEWGEIHDCYLNDGRGKFSLLPWTEGRFLDEDGHPISATMMDYGLSVQIRDLNQDGFPDIYVCNDFHTPDRCWLNDGHGHFRLCPRETFRSISYASMGMDAADLDRDGRFDLFDAEMKPTSHDRLIRQITGVKFTHPVIGEIENRVLTPRNTFSWNRGDGTYAEIAYYAGLHASDWTWMPLCLDVDLDGFEDILVVNGYSHNVNDQDLLRELTPDAINRNLQEHRAQLLMFPPYSSPNYAFRNLGNLTFEEVGKSWGFAAPELSHGMAAADLDNDGDLDVVINCLNAPALIYRNDCPAPRLAVRLKGRGPNTQGINSLIKVYGGPVPMQMQEIIAGGRYLSGDDPMRTFACNQATNLTIEVTWRTGQRSVLSGARPDYIYEINEAAAVAPLTAAPAAPLTPWFKDVSDAIKHRHFEEAFDDFARQPLLPNRLSQSGPGIAWFDLDGDGKDDLMIGTGKGGRLAVYRNDGQGGFVLVNTGPATNLLERDSTTILGWHPQPGQTALLAGLSYYEDGHTNGQMVLQMSLSQLLPGLPAAASSVGAMALADVDGDGDLDLFVGGRVLPGRYPEAASSGLFINDSGQLKPGEKNAALFRGLGLVTGAVFSDLNQDGQPDLVLACEWGPIRVFLNQQGQFKEATKELGLSELTGWWTGVTTGDFDGDGRLDIVAGNWGLNSHYRASAKYPARLFYGDFNGRGEVDLVEAYEELTPGKVMPRRNLMDMSGGLPFLALKYPKHELYAKATVAEMLGDRMKSARELQAVTLASTLFRNRGGRFEATPLTAQAQWAPVFAVCVADADGDGQEDLFLSQNFFATQLGVTRLDAGRGLWLKGDGAGNFEPVPGQVSGVKVYGEQRGAAVGDYDGDGRVDLAVSQNGAPTKLYRNTEAKAGLRIRLNGGPKNPTGVGAQARMITGGKPGPVREVHAGSGWWSQDSAVVVLAAGEEIEVRWPWGKTVKAAIPAAAREIEMDASGTVKKLK